MKPRSPPGAQGKISSPWSTLIQANQSHMDRDQFIRYAALLHLDAKRFRAGSRQPSFRPRRSKSDCRRWPCSRRRHNANPFPKRTALSTVHKTLSSWAATVQAGLCYSRRTLLLRPPPRQLPYWPPPMSLRSASTPQAARGTRRRRPSPSLSSPTFSAPSAAVAADPAASNCSLSRQVSQ